MTRNRDGGPIALRTRLSVVALALSLAVPAAAAARAEADASTIDRVLKEAHAKFAGVTEDEDVFLNGVGVDATGQVFNSIVAVEQYKGHQIKDDPKMVTDVYTRQCSINVSAKNLAVMAGTLANGGKNPVTKKQVIDPDHVPNVLAVMATAGLYDDSGIAIEYVAEQLGANPYAVEPR